jgi:hypothetical protein
MISEFAFCMSIFCYPGLIWLARKPLKGEAELVVQAHFPLFCIAV